MNTSLVDKQLKEIQSVMNRRHYTQFILPLLKTIESSNNKVINIKVKSIVEKVISSSMAKLQAQSEEIANVNYVTIDKVMETIQDELNTYL